MRERENHHKHRTLGSAKHKGDLHYQSACNPWWRCFQQNDHMCTAMMEQTEGHQWSVLLGKKLDLWAMPRI